MRRKPLYKRPIIPIAIFLIILAVIGIRQVFNLNTLLNVVTPDELQLRTAAPKQERVNILLLGIGGGRHEGPNLTDTIIFTSIDPERNKATMISIPRDLWVADIRAKVNTAYAFGEEKQEGGGKVLAKVVVSKVVGQPVDYVVRIDFDGFIKAVDLLGGLDILVDQTFDDYAYPIGGKENDTCGKEGEDFEKAATAASQLEAFPCRYMHVHFDEGPQHIDGETALVFVRSRHALGPEGSDFARSKRQSKVISAFREKLFSAGTLLNLPKMLSLYNVLKDSIDTDIQQEEFDDFLKIAQKMREAQITSGVIDEGDSKEGRPPLVAPPGVTAEFNNQWVLAPAIGSNDFSEIHAYVACQIGTGSCPTPTPNLLTPSPTTRPRIISPGVSQ